LGAEHLIVTRFHDNGQHFIKLFLAINSTIEVCSLNYLQIIESDEKSCKIKT